MAQRGGTATEREGRFGTELMCEMRVERPEGPAMQPSRIIGINGSRWLLRATLLGRPALEPDAAGGVGGRCSPTSPYAAAPRRCPSASRSRWCCPTARAGSAAA